VARRLTVLKIGGSLIEDGSAAGGSGPALLDRVAAAWEAGEEILLVHGGGAELGRWLERLGIGSRFVDGQRVTTKEALPVALMVLGGLINRRLVEALLGRGCPAVGLTGADGSGTRAAPDPRPGLGSVGRIVSVNAPFYRSLIAARRLPVVASLSLGPEGGWLNVNADLMAGALAAGLGARRLLMMTDVNGVRGGDGATLRTLTLPGLRRLIDSGTAREGMVPKLEACGVALAARVPEVRILGPDAAVLSRALGNGAALDGPRGSGTRVLTEARP